MNINVLAVLKFVLSKFCINIFYSSKITSKQLEIISH